MEVPGGDGGASTQVSAGAGASGLGWWHMAQAEQGPIGLSTAQEQAGSAKRCTSVHLYDSAVSGQVSAATHLKGLMSAVVTASCSGLPVSLRPLNTAARNLPCWLATWGWACRHEATRRAMWIV